LYLTLSMKAQMFDYALSCPAIPKRAPPPAPASTFAATSIVSGLSVLSRKAM